MLNNKLFSKIFMYLALGLLISFGVGYGVSTNEELIFNVFSKYYIWIIIIELVLAFSLSIFIRKLSKTMTTIFYIAYSFFTGLTLSSIFIAYEMYSIIFIFLITSVIFVALAVYGYTTEKDITKFGTILFFGLIGVVIMTLLNLIIFKSSSMDIIISIVSMLIFTCFIAYDVNVIKRGFYKLDEDKLAVYGAFQLYLDFINLFLDLLRLFGKGKD